MKTQTKLSAKDIKANMTKEKWDYYTTGNAHEIHIRDKSNMICWIGEMYVSGSGNTNGEAVVNAVNNTYGKNINPEAVSGLLKALNFYVNVCGTNCSHVTQETAMMMYNEASKAISKATITP